jgi:hypothetical protein
MGGKNPKSPCSMLLPSSLRKLVSKKLDTVRQANIRETSDDELIQRLQA